MGDGRDDIMDLDLNLVPPVPPSSPIESMELGERIRRLEEVAHRSRHRWRRWRQDRTLSETRNISMISIVNPPVEIVRTQIGEGSVAAMERSIEIGKKCRGNRTDLIAKALESGDNVEKETSDNSSFFDCNICFDMASDPVLTSCGHLFCWPCLYQWIHVHSNSKECPVCKGEVTDMNITPIYGRGSDTGEVDKEQEVAGLKVPPRPQARRIESFRQSIHRAESPFSFQEIIQRIGNRLDERANRILTSSGTRRERSELFPNLAQNNLGAQDDIVDLIQGNAANSEAEESLRLPSSRLLLRSHLQRGSSLSYLSTALSSAERFVHFIGHPTRRNHNRSPPIEDRDSVSSIAAVIHSESQTVDTAMEIDSMVSLSSDTSRVSDVDSGVSRAPRRRRLN